MLGVVPANRRYAFHKGKLFVEEDEDILMVHPWPNPWARIRPAEASGWKPTVPQFPVVAPIRRPTRRTDPRQLELGLVVETTPTAADKRRIALSRFRARIPKPIAKLVEPVRSLQWHHLVACAMSDRFGELLSSNPVLAYLWIESRQGRFGTPDVTKAASTSQRELLSQLGFLHSKAAVKFLRKCYAPALCLTTAEGLREVMRNESSLARLHHIPRAGSGLIALARCPVLLEACVPALLDEVASHKEELYRAPTAMRLENHLEMCRQLGRELPRPFRSRQDLHRAHRDLIREYQERQRQEKKPRQGEFGLPPIPGTQNILPLTTAAALRREGREQDNCVASYASRVSNGSHYIYRVTWPQRCTLSIVKGPDGRWRRGELEVAGNRPANSHTGEVVDTWLRHGQRLLTEEG